MEIVFILYEKVGSITYEMFKRKVLWTNIEFR